MAAILFYWSYIDLSSILVLVGVFGKLRCITNITFKRVQVMTTFCVDTDSVIHNQCIITRVGPLGSSRVLTGINSPWWWCVRYAGRMAPRDGAAPVPSAAWTRSIFCNRSMGVPSDINLCMILLPGHLAESYCELFFQTPRHLAKSTNTTC